MSRFTAPPRTLVDVWATEITPLQPKKRKTSTAATDAATAGQVVTEDLCAQADETQQQSISKSVRAKAGAVPKRSTELLDARRSSTHSRQVSIGEESIFESFTEKCSHTLRRGSYDSIRSFGSTLFADLQTPKKVIPPAESVLLGRSSVENSDFNRMSRLSSTRSEASISTRESSALRFPLSLITPRRDSTTPSEMDSEAPSPQVLDQQIDQNRTNFLIGSQYPLGSWCQQPWQQSERVTKDPSQRSTTNLYKSKVFFPNGMNDEGVFHRQSIIAATAYICKNNYGCQMGNCASNLSSFDIARLRQEARCFMKTTNMTQAQFVTDKLLSSYDARTSTFSYINLQLDAVTTVQVCITAWSLANGFSSTLLQSVVSKIKSGEVLESTEHFMYQNRIKNINERRSLQFTQLRKFITRRPSLVDSVGALKTSENFWKTLYAGEYVRTLVFTHEMNPAPGAARRAAGETTLSKRSWIQKWDDCKLYFRKNNLEAPGSICVLKKAWKLETRLKERVSKSHSKCDICAEIDAKLFKVTGLSGAAAEESRLMLKMAFMEHEEKHLNDRSILDTAGFRATVEPRSIWTLLCDAATENTYMLPRFGRRPKCFGSRPFFHQKLMSVREDTRHVL